jgi:hypothetical protein
LEGGGAPEREGQLGGQKLAGDATDAVGPEELSCQGALGG